MSAANGRFTTVINMANTIPKTNAYESFKEKIQIAKKKSVVENKTRKLKKRKESH